MSFHLSAENIKIENMAVLYADLQKENGEFARHVYVDFDQSIGNNNGMGALAPSMAVKLTFDGDGAPILRAKLKDADGELRDASINLAERLQNINGRFVL